MVRQRQGSFAKQEPSARCPEFVESHRVLLRLGSERISSVGASGIGCRFRCGGSLVPRVRRAGQSAE